MKCVPIKGIITPILTPMNADESVNLDELRRQIERLIAGGRARHLPLWHQRRGLHPQHGGEDQRAGGHHRPGEGPGPRLRRHRLRHTITLSREAERLGADILSIITPSFAVASQQELYDHYCAVAAHVDTPIVLYNIPARTGNKLLPETVCRLAKDVDFSVLSGNDSLILPALKEGGVGGIAGCSNVYPMVLSSIYELFQEGKLDEAQAAQDSIASFRAVFKYGNPNTVVKTAAMLGYNVGKCRAPFNQLPQEGLEALEKVLQENKDKGMC